MTQTECAVQIGDEIFTAASIAELCDWAAQGRFAPEANVFHPSLQQWVRAGDVPELRAVFRQSASAHVCRACGFVGTPLLRE